MAKKLMKMAFLACIMIIIVSMLSVSCSSKTEETQTETTPTLKIGIIFSLSWPNGVSGLRTIQTDVDMTNKAGGLLIGGKKYLLELDVQDHNFDDAKAKLCAEKLIYQDKVQYIVGDFWYSGYVPVTEINKVIVTVNPPDPDQFIQQNYKYAFMGGDSTSTCKAVMGWMLDRFPGKKTMVFAMPDDSWGHMEMIADVKIAEGLGYEILDQLFYPGAATDFSAVGLKVKSLNPDFLDAAGGGPERDAMVMKAAYDAGYEGIVFSAAPVPTQSLVAVAGTKAIEGIYAGAWPVEFDPPLTQKGVDWKKAYIEKFGSWDSPEIICAPPYWMLKAALQASKSPDPDDVAAAIRKGMAWEDVAGSARMIARPDLGYNTPVELIHSFTIKQIVAGQPKVIEVLSLDYVEAVLKEAFGIK